MAPLYDVFSFKSISLPIINSSGNWQPTLFRYDHFKFVFSRYFKPSNVTSKQEYWIKQIELMHSIVVHMLTKLISWKENTPYKTFTPENGKGTPFLSGWDNFS